MISILLSLTGLLFARRDSAMESISATSQRLLAIAESLNKELKNVKIKEEDLATFSDLSIDKTESEKDKFKELTVKTEKYITKEDSKENRSYKEESSLIIPNLEKLPELPPIESGDEAF